MIILSLRTDKPEAELGLYDDHAQLGYETWEAHRQLAETIHHKIDALLKTQHKNWSDLEGIVCFQGPGSFTGLRIGLTVANTLSYSLAIPIVATQGKDWLTIGLDRLAKHEADPLALPFYGAPVHTTTPKH